MQSDKSKSKDISQPPEMSEHPGENQRPDGASSLPNSPDKKLSLNKSQVNARPKHQLQLFNPAHKSDLTKIFKSLYKFRLNSQEECSEKLQPQDSSKTEEDLEEVEIFGEDDAEEITVLDNKIEIGESQQCTICGCSFVSSTVAEKREHYRLDWHRYNVKRRAHGQFPVNELEFDEIMDGLSSISGSDDSTDSDEDSTSGIMKLMSKVEAASLESNLPKPKRDKTEHKLQGSPKLAFSASEADVVLIYKAILPSEVLSRDEFTFVNLIDLASYFYSEAPPKWAVVMLSGGHFAAAIVQGGNELRHKTFHSYTVRRKQGGGQSSHDSKSGTSSAKSAGASLRRYNEASFTQHVQELLESWKDDLESCDAIFYHALGFNKRILFGGKSPSLPKNSTKLRTIPFPTKRPTNNEVKRVVTLLSAIQVYSNEDFFNQFIKPVVGKCKKGGENSESPSKTRKPKKSNPNIDRARSRSPKKRNEPELASSTPEDSDDPNITFQLQEVHEEIDLVEQLEEYGDSLTNEERVKGRQMMNQKTRTKMKLKKVKPPEFETPKGIYGDLLNALESTVQSSKSILELLEMIKSKETCLELNQFINEQNSTFLHLASKRNFLDVIWKLMELGADPSTKEKNGKYPYNYAESKECRNVFRKFRAAFPEKYDYQKSQIPEPLTEEMEKQKAEKKALQNRLKREKDKLKKMEQYEQKKEVDEKERFLNLSDREKRALAAERRILGQYKHCNEIRPVLVRCFDCGIDITGKVPFEYNKNVFCTTKCLAAHRKKFPVPLSI